LIIDDQVAGRRAAVASPFGVARALGRLRRPGERAQAVRPRCSTDSKSAAPSCIACFQQDVSSTSRAGTISPGVMACFGGVLASPRRRARLSVCSRAARRRTTSADRDHSAQ
jgi:hypothetical protein